MHRWAVNVYFLVNGFVFANWAARIPALQSLFDLNNKETGFILLAHSVGAFIAMPITGSLISKYTSRKVAMVSAVIFPFFFQAIPWMNSFFTLLFPFLFMGFFAGMMDVSMNAQAVEVEKYKKKPIMTTFHAFFSIGMMLGGFLSSYIISNEIQVSNHFGLVFMIVVVLIILFSFYLFPDEPVKEEKKMPWIVIPKGPILWLGIIAFCSMLGEGAISDWSAVYLKEVINAPAYLYAIGITAFAATMTAGRLLGDTGRQFIGDRMMLVLGSVLAIIGMGFVLCFHNPYLVIIGFGLVGLGTANIVPIIYSLSGSMPGINPGVGIAMATTVGYSGFMFGPAVIGFIADAYSLRAALLLIVILFVLMLFIIRSVKI
ncbi:MFS transporter [Portibacter lacus]|uniref:MFS transporter n=1 Tax=Portibacter lacus TaxID=1099794 RepID=A0AA37SQQ3_9BACT|nr:MFS transporter [Portibacter lacus]GLR17959.1 MFS transporter [Portibacter lacus]